VVAAATAGVIAGYGIAVPVGAIGAYLMSLTARTSLGTGLVAGAGVATADALYALFAVTAGGVAARALAPMASTMTVLATTVLLALGVRIVWSAVRGYQQAQPAPARSPAGGRGLLGTFLSLVGLTLANPATVIYFVALVISSRSVAGAVAVDRAAFVLGVLAASASWQFLLATGGAAVGRALSGRRGRLVTGICSGTLVATLGLHSVVGIV
jgi:arginine exporter protein ArgO